MKKFVFLMAMLFIVAALMAGTDAVKPEKNSVSQEKYPFRDIFYTEDFESGATGWTHYDGAVTPNQWHIYAGDGSVAAPCWWMGDEADNGGYHDHQYLVLDTPVIAISTGNSSLTFNMKHGLEEPGVSGDYDGWDSFNIRISTNSGVSWTVIPTTLLSVPYDFANSYAFGSEHGEGLGIPGWGGQRPWTSVTADLSSYLVSGAANVKIRFAFASDPAYNTDDDPTLIGVRVDDIVLAGYSNNGVADGQMTFTSLVPTAGDFWHIATDASAPSPTHIMSCKNSANTYVNNMLNYLESPDIILPTGATQIVADFQMRGSYYDPGTFPDVDYFGWEIFYNGNWHYMSNPYDDPNGSNYVYSGAPDTWASMINSYTLDGDITALAGQTVRFAWYFQSNDTTPSGTPLEIDDFQIFSVSAAPATPNLVYPLNGATGLPYTGFDLDWTASSLGALPEYYNVYLDQTEANLELATFAPTYASDNLTVSYYDPVAASLMTFAPGERWYWCVSASIAGQPDAFSQIFRFDIVTAGTVITTFPWDEGFEGTTFPPTNWTSVNVDGAGTTWAVNTTSPYYHSGTKSAVHAYSTAVPDPGQNGWLISPPVELPATGVAAFSFWNYNRYGYEVYNGVKINSNNDPMDPGWVEIWTQDETAGHWAQETVNLSAYAGQIIYFGFQYTGYDANNWYVDDVNVTVYTSDVLAPLLSGHLPLINTPREDLTWPVTIDVVDDAVFNNPISAVNLYWSLDAGTTWSTAIPMTLTTGTTYAGTLPTQPLGSTVTYKFEALDSIGNLGSATFSYAVADPIWISYDKGLITGYTGYPTYVWGPMIYYENPFYGTTNAMKLLAVDGAVHNNNTGNPPTTVNVHVYSDDGVNLTDLITPVVASLPHRTRTTVDLSALNIQITTPWFWVSFEDMPLGCYFGYNGNYDYTTLYLMISGDGIYYSSSTGEWTIGAQVQTGDPWLYFAPEVSIAMGGGGYPEVSWAALPGAASYDVYGANDPYATWPGSWTVLGDNVAASPYVYTGTAPMQFFKVVASTNTGGGKAARNIYGQSFPTAIELIKTR
jgi:hypothetical protein